MDAAKEVERIVDWIGNYAQKAGIETLVIGVSGGVDSAVVFRLCEKTGLKVIGVSMPMNTREAEKLNPRVDALFRCSKAEYRYVEIQPIVAAYQNQPSWVMDNTNPSNGDPHDRFLFSSKLGSGNLRARVRANILYEIAGTHKGLVVGTDNYDESMLGYFTKGGDGLVDILPITHLHKSAVYKLAEVLNVPQSIIDVAPSANLWDGQTDEEELGMTYDEIEVALDFYEGKRDFKLTDLDRWSEVMDSIDARVRATEHKRRLPPGVED